MTRGLWILFAAWALLATPSARAAAPGLLYVEVEGAIPGVRLQEAPNFVAKVLDEAHLGARFTSGLGWHRADRIVWTFRANPYAGGASRHVGPGALRDEPAFGTHRLYSVETRLFLDGQYQVTLYGQVELQGGVTDRALTEFLRDQAKKLIQAGS